MEAVAKAQVLVCAGTLKPKHYELRIEPDLEKGRYEGAVTIEVEVLQASSTIIINVQSLVIHSTVLYDEEGISISLASTRAEPATQTFVITPAVVLPHGSKVFIHQAFSGTLGRDESCKGFFLSPQSTVNSSLPPIASTSLEPSYARSVFPCFDDPSLKATFALTLVLAQHLTALSNTPLKSTRAERLTCYVVSPKKLIEFEITPLLPPYLLAFVIGTLSYVENNDLRFPLRAYATNEHEIEKCRSTLDFAARALAVLEKDFEIDCKLEKLDIVAIPGTTIGMENWGLITVYPCALVIGAQHSARDKVKSMELIAHEIAHQYFGNLVTIQSWDCFWLKEGLSEWAETYIRSRLGDGETVVEFVSEGLQRALKSDEGRFGHALETSVDNGDGGWREMYDDITYKKGHAIIQMLEKELGSDVFMQGVSIFLKENLYGTVTPNDFWKVLDRVSGEDVSGMMRIWTQHAGYPVLDIEENEAAGTITVSQSRFYKNGSERVETDEILYPIPINILTPTGVVREKLSDKQRVFNVLTHCYKLNAGQTGFYRIAYSRSRLAILGNDLCREAMSVPDKIGLISDATALCFSSHSSIRMSDLLSFLQNFEDETSYFVWKVIISSLRRIASSLLFEDRALKDAFQQYWRHLVSRCLYRNASFSAYDDLNEQMFKALMFGNSGGDEKVVQAAFAMFERWTGVETKVINPNIRTQVFEIVLSKGGKKEYRKLVDLLKYAKDPVRRDILSSLGHARHYSSLKETLKRATSLESVLNSEMAMILKPMTTHKKGIFVLWRFMATGAWTKNPNLSMARAAPISQMLLDSLTRIEQCESARKALSGYDTSTFEKEIDRCFEDIEVRTKWLERDKKDILQWLSRNGYMKKTPSKFERGIRSAGKIAHLVGFA